MAEDPHGSHSRETRWAIGATALSRHRRLAARADPRDWTRTGRGLGRRPSPIARGFPATGEGGRAGRGVESAGRLRSWRRGPACAPGRETPRQGGHPRTEDTGPFRAPGCHAGHRGPALTCPAGANQVSAESSPIGVFSTRHNKIQQLWVCTICAVKSKTPKFLMPVTYPILPSLKSQIMQYNHNQEKGINRNNPKNIRAEGINRKRSLHSNEKNAPYAPEKQAGAQERSREMRSA